MTESSEGLRARRVLPLLVARDCLDALSEIVIRLEDHDGSLHLAEQCVELKVRVTALVQNEHRRVVRLHPPARVMFYPAPRQR